MSDVGWGLGEWGTSPWGFGADVTLTVVSAQASTIRSVIVTLSQEPLALSPIGTGDALNPRTWILVRDDTMEAIVVYGARMVDNTTVELLLIDTLPNAAVNLTVSSNTLLAANGSAIEYPRSYTFPGLGYAFNPGTSAAQSDLRSNNVPGVEHAGGLVVGTSGDYEREAGARLLRKLIVRRIISVVGEWAHMPQYGASLQVKVPLARRDLPMIASALEKQIELEPEVDAAQVTLQYTSATGVMIVNYTVKTVGGAQLAGQFPDQAGVINE